MFVYGIRFGKYVKIGCSENPADRLRALPGKIRRPDDLAGDDIEPLFAMAGDFETERFLHNLFEPARAVGEWYHYDLMATDLSRVAMSSDRLVDAFRIRLTSLEDAGIIKVDPDLEPLPAPVDF